MRRMAQMGLENAMNLGMSCVAWRRPLRHPDALNYEDKQHRRRECQRDVITVPQLLSYLDQDHERKVFSYQWLWVLGEYMEQVKNLCEHANFLLRTRGAILEIPKEPDHPFTISTTSGAEHDLPKFLSSIFDFMKSMGQTKEDHMVRMFPLGGDGLTYELYGRIMEQRQLHPGEFTSLRVLNRKMEWWHTEWTNDLRIINKHLVSYASKDPSTLGHSALKIARTIRINQGKYDYNQGSELMYFVLDMRMLDCWRLILLREAKQRKIDVTADTDLFEVVKRLGLANVIPELEEFESLADELNRTYSTEGAIYRSANGLLDSNSVFPPKGSIWEPSVPVSTIVESPEAVTSLTSRVLDALDSDVTLATTPKTKKQAKTVEKPPPTADSVLSRSQDFIREAMRSREMKWAVADGDPGRVYEQMKRAMFCFAGSSHQKYAQYLLETVIDLELESSPELR
ncbi:hypothetical protein HHX47_DHR6000352 [Lentinula edodes]|nr:hypothetical protein HHX47_DHR6000352 [Lentinula edodes]